MVMCRYAIPFFRWIWWDVLSDATQQYFSRRVGQIIPLNQGEDSQTWTTNGEEAITLEQPTAEEAIEDALSEV